MINKQPTQQTQDYITMKRAQQICRTEAPYPLNYLPYGNDQQKTIGAALVGLLIHKEMF